MKKIIFFLFAMYYVLCAKSPIHAVSEFSTDFRSTYEISSRGVSHVTHDIKITNNLSHIYTTEYAIQIGSPKLDNVTATSNGKPLTVSASSDVSSTTIKIGVTNPAIGLGAVTEIILSYDTTDIAEKIGSNWEINVPRLARANEAVFYSRKLIFPDSFGEPSIISPSPTTVSNEGGQRAYEFVGYSRDSISLIFGKVQHYQVDLKYKIKNPTLGTSHTEIALPPDTSYQKVIIDSLNPAPKSVKLDEDGNWLAVYSLKSQEQRQITAKIFVTVAPVPSYDLTLPLNPKALTPENKYWSRSAKIKDVGDKLTKPQEIYSYLVDNFTYDYRRVGKNERLGAEKALDNPTSAICTEYTDSFVALARANKIPAVEINGYAYTSSPYLKPTSEDILHAWPAYYDQDKKIWYQVDPTWGSTTGGTDYFHQLDFSHIAFVIHGSESEYPIPAGAYKDNQEEKTVVVSLEDNIPIATATYSTESTNDKLVITATGNSALHHQTVVYNNQAYQVDYLPPYGAISFPLQTKLNFFTRLLTWFHNIFKL